MNKKEVRRETVVLEALEDSETWQAVEAYFRSEFSQKDKVSLIDSLDWIYTNNIRLCIEKEFTKEADEDRDSA
jgi:hypothetical protein